MNTWREVLFCALYFGVYETAKSGLGQLFYETTGERHDVLSIMIAGGMSVRGGFLFDFPAPFCVSLTLISLIRIPGPFLNRVWLVGSVASL